MSSTAPQSRVSPTDAPVRVALVTYFCPPYRRPLFVELSQRMDLTFFFTSRGTEWYELGDRPKEIEGLRTVALTSPVAIYRELASGNYDAIITSLTGRAALLATFGAARVRRLPLVLWVEIWEHPRTFAHRLSRPVARALYSSADAIVAFGPHVADFLDRESNTTAEVFIATHAVDNERLSQPVSRERVAKVRARFDLDEHPTVTFVGRLEEEKGVADLIVASAGITAPHQIVIAGRGPLLASLQQLAKTLLIDDRVRFVGHLPQDELTDLLNASDLLVLPSSTSRRSRETWGMVVNEAMNCGLPVVASDAVGAAAGGLVVQDATGLVVPEQDPQALALALEELIRDESKRHKLGDAARTHVLAWTHDRAADAFEQALSAAIRRRKGS